MNTYIWYHLWGGKSRKIRGFRPFLSLVKNIKVRTDGMRKRRKRYRRLKYTFKDSIEVYEHLDARYGAPGEKRREKREATPEQIRKRNQWNRERKVRHILKTWFQENDYLALLTYRKDARPPDMDKAKADFKKARDAVKKEYRKRGHELRWLRNIEVGAKGAWHIHMVINRIQDTDLILKKAWPHGKVTFKHLYEEGGFADLAGYITKTPETANRYRESLVETSYSRSRNLPVKEPERQELAYWPKEPREKKGYYVEKGTYHEGVNPATGCKYRYYTLVKIKQGGARSGCKNLHRDQPARPGRKRREVCSAAGAHDG